MIDLKMVESRKDNPLGGCKEFFDSLDKHLGAKEIFFIAGVGCQLQNMGLIDTLFKMDSRLVLCWWRLFDSGFRPKNPVSLRNWFVQETGMKSGDFDNLMYWYTRYLDKDFFDRIRRI